MLKDVVCLWGSRVFCLFVVCFHSLLRSWVKKIVWLPITNMWCIVHAAVLPPAILPQSTLPEASEQLTRDWEVQRRGQVEEAFSNYPATVHVNAFLFHVDGSIESKRRPSPSHWCVSPCGAGAWWLSTIPDFSSSTSSSPRTKSCSHKRSNGSSSHQQMQAVSVPGRSWVSISSDVTAQISGGFHSHGGTPSSPDGLCCN